MIIERRSPFCLNISFETRVVASSEAVGLECRESTDRLQSLKVAKRHFRLLIADFQVDV
jgi:hypothetical protein